MEIDEDVEAVTALDPQTYALPQQPPNPASYRQALTFEEEVELVTALSSQTHTPPRQPPNLAVRRLISGEPPKKQDRSQNNKASTTWQLKTTPIPSSTAPSADAPDIEQKVQVILPPYTVAAPTIEVVMPGKAVLKPIRNAVSTRGSKPSATDLYGHQLAKYPPAAAQPPQHVPIGMLEILFILPNAVQGIPEVAMRALMNGWTQSYIVSAEGFADNKLDDMDDDAFTTACNRITHQFKDAGKAMIVIDREWDASIPGKAGYTGNVDLTPDNWRFKSQWVGSDRQAQFQHVSLRSLYGRIENWPTGPDALTLTQCLLFAQANPKLELDTSHWDWIINILGLTPNLALDDNHDKAAIGRFIEYLCARYGSGDS